MSKSPNFLSSLCIQFSFDLLSILLHLTNKTSTKKDEEGKKNHCFSVKWVLIKLKSESHVFAQKKFNFFWIVPLFRKIYTIIKSKLFQDNSSISFIWKLQLKFFYRDLTFHILIELRSYERRAWHKTPLLMSHCVPSLGDNIAQNDQNDIIYFSTISSIKT